jgi:hypothetical protein
VIGLSRLLAWLALVVGAPQMLLGVLGLYGGGWWMLVWLGLILLPPLPLILMQPSQPWPKRNTAVSPALAVISLLISCLVYGRVLYALIKD